MIKRYIKKAGDTGKWALLSDRGFSGWTEIYHKYEDARRALRRARERDHYVNLTFLDDSYTEDLTNYDE